MKKSNRELIEKKIASEGFTIGCYDIEMDKLSKKELDKVLSQVDQESTDIIVNIRRKPYIVEISTVDNEKDLSILSKQEYIDRYGDEKFQEE